ncbi:Alpha-L-fucosidase [Cyclobacterium qasimii M12-11B]|uniref:alpha-L-fucosidase n=2 Tax=Cyclobacterium qasimii TaxID=1350429 RepID=S7WWF0_9BACT|nr:Alpha-L-fucosidase [Cyclobacterium qasimii M12-11B]
MSYLPNIKKTIMNFKLFILGLSIVLFVRCQPSQTDPLTPVLPIPDERQLAWQGMEFYAFAHFNMNTFTNMEWGLGDEDPSMFNPTDFDPKQWAKVCKEAGMKGIIITAKHHDGFCLWPTATTEHSVKNAAWKDGKGDIIKEVAEAFRAEGLKFGVYLSPWDRNNADYGTPKYVETFRAQLRELLTNYGEVFEVWFDGANGGSGYYGGANEERRVDKKSYYDWPTTFAMIRELQPNAVVFGDAGPDVRWVGNEHGFAYESTWSNLLRDSVYAGMPEYSKKYSRGQENGTHWVPAEADVSIRPGWYYHPYEDHKVKTLPQLLDIYYNSIGRNSSLLLNFPVDKTGQIHENDVTQLMKLVDKVKEDFSQKIPLKSSNLSASSENGDYVVENLLSSEMKSSWSPASGDGPATVTIDFDEVQTFNRFLVQENISLGQRVKSFELEIQNENGEWKSIAKETTIGYKRILRLPETKTTAVKFTIHDAKDSPVISHLAFYDAPKLLLPPAVDRDKNGTVKLNVVEEGVQVYYSLDGKDPVQSGKVYTQEFEVMLPTKLMAVTKDPISGKFSEVIEVNLQLAKKNWTVVGGDENSGNLIDEDPSTNYISNQNIATIDLGEKQEVSGFTYYPMQNRYLSGLIKTYVFYTSVDGNNWQKAAEGEFGNIANSPIEQRIEFDQRSARFIQLKAKSTTDDQPASFAELGVLLTE